MSNIEQCAKQLAEQLNDIKFTDIDTRPLRKSDIVKLTNKQIVRIRHNKGFVISIRKKYVIELFCNIPTLIYSVDKYMVADDLLGVHPVEFNKDDMVEYVKHIFLMSHQ